MRTTCVLREGHGVSSCHASFAIPRMLRFYGATNVHSVCRITDSWLHPEESQKHPMPMFTSCCPGFPPPLAVCTLFVHLPARAGVSGVRIPQCRPTKAWPSFTIPCITRRAPPGHHHQKHMQSSAQCCVTRIFCILKLVRVCSAATPATRARAVRLHVTHAESGNLLANPERVQGGSSWRRSRFPRSCRTCRRASRRRACSAA